MRHHRSLTACSMASGAAGCGGGRPGTAGFGAIFSTCCFAQLSHHSLPGLVQPIGRKRRLKFLFFWALVGTFVIYASLGGVLSSYFGDLVRPVLQQKGGGGATRAMI